MLTSACEKEGIKYPENPNKDYDATEYPHFTVFCNAQLGRAMQPGEHWENAKVIAKISEEDIFEVTVDDLRKLGFMGL